MLSENAKNALPEKIVRRLEDINKMYLSVMGKRISEFADLRPSDAHRLAQMLKGGADIREIKKEIRRTTQKSQKEIEDIFETVARDGIETSKALAQANGTYIPYEANAALRQWVKSLAAQSADTFINLSNATAFMTYDKNGTKVTTSLADTYNEVIDRAVTAATSGTVDYKAAMRKTLKDLADSGIRTVAKEQTDKTGRAGYVADYASGYSRRLDTAVRQNLLWGIKQCNIGVQELIFSGIGADGYEIDYHRNPRPSHADMGGKQFVCGEGRYIGGKWYDSFEEKAEPLLKEYGCLHFKTAIICGVSRPTYTDGELKALKAADKKTFVFEGEEYTGYEATQMQRKLETAIRHARDRVDIAAAAGDDMLRRTEKYKLTLLTDKYRKFSEAAGLSFKTDRLRMSKIKPKELTNGVNGGIMEKESKKDITVITDRAVKSIPKINISGYTDEQCTFIQQQHKELLQYAKDNNDNKEVAFVFRKGLTDRTEFIGSDESLDFGSGLFGKGNELFVMHNHPRNSSFSYADIIEFVSANQIKALSIVKNNGSIEAITKKSEYNKKAITIDILRSIKKHVKNNSNDEYNNAIKIILKKAEQKGHIEWIR